MPYSHCKNLTELCAALNENPPPADFDFNTLPNFGEADWHAKLDPAYVAAWSDEQYIEIRDVQQGEPEFFLHDYDPAEFE